MGIRSYEVGDFCYLVFNESASYVILQVRVKECTGKFEGDKMIQTLRMEQYGKNQAFIDKVVIHNNVENSMILPFFKDAFDQCENDKPIHFHDINGSLTVLTKALSL
jgi:hypothetical protein